jgi:hypothetical protein
MDLTDAQKATLKDFEKSEEGTRTRFRVVGCHERTGSLRLRAEQEFVLMPNGLTREP